MRRPPQPYNLTVHPYRNSLLLRWQSRRWHGSGAAAAAGAGAEPFVDDVSAASSSQHWQVRRPPADYYVVEYRTVGQWVPLVDRVVGRTSYNWTTASRGATYHFRVIAYYRAPLPDDDRRVGDAATDLPRRPVASIPSPIVTFHTGGTRAVSAVRYMALIPRDSFSRSILVTS